MADDPKHDSYLRTTHEKRHSWWEHPIVDVVAKVGVPVVLAIFTGLAAIMANRVQNQMSAATLVSEREKAESQLRADMFKSLIEPILGFEKGARIDPDREQLLVELLALNFHEHFEMKPLLQRVDQGLKLIKNKRTEEDRREALRSIVRRLIDRQVAALQREGGRSSTPQAKVDTLIIMDAPKDQNPEQQGYIDGFRNQPEVKEGKNKVVVLTEGTDQIEVESTDRTHRLVMAIANVDWAGQEVKAAMSKCPPKPSTCLPPVGRFEISASWADLPFTDNTLFADGNRFAVTVYRVAYSGPDHPETPLNTAWLHLIWFPKDYYTPRERPFDQDQFLQTVGKRK